MPSSKEYYQQRYAKKKDSIKKYKKSWYLANRERLLAKAKERLASKRAERNEQLNGRYKTDLNYKLQCNLRNRLNIAIKRGYKAGSAVRDLGCSIADLRIYLESQFEPGMTWQNHNLVGWHIDHIKPLTSFDLSDRKQFLQACHYTNLRPMWYNDNIRKGGRGD